jgi:hypothetical protein
MSIFSDAFQRLVDLRTATMYNHRVHPHQFQQHDIVRETFLQPLVDHRVAAVFDDDGPAMKAADVRQGLGKNNRPSVREGSARGPSSYESGNERRAVYRAGLVCALPRDAQPD